MDRVKIILSFIEKRYGISVGRTSLSNKEIFELLVETVLSQRTRDENSERAARELFKFARTPEQIMKLPMKKLQGLIRISGPYRQKAKRIKEISKVILDNGGIVPKTREELMELPGVGPKTADIVLMYGFNVPSIAVDTHVNTVSKRLGLADRKDDVEDVKESLEAFFPRKKWYLINLGFVMFGKEICKPRPLCVRDRKNCPFSGFCRAYKTKNFKV